MWFPVVEKLHHRLIFVSPFFVLFDYWFMVALKVKETKQRESLIMGFASMQSVYNYDMMMMMMKESCDLVLRWFLWSFKITA
jgi:hypothetical protein